MAKQSRDKKSFLVIGMGRFGRYLALKLQELGNSVMVVDEEQELSPEISALFDDYIIGDCKNESFIRTLGVGNFDICFVTIGANFESSIIVTSLLKSHGAKYIVTKAGQEIQADVLKKIGADEIIYPERELAEKLAVRYDMNSIFDFIELSDGYAIYEISVPGDWVGHSIAKLDIRQRYKLNILAVKNNSALLQMPSAEYIFNESDLLVVMGESENVEGLLG